MGDKTIKEEVKKRMKEETPLTDKIQIGLSPITHLRKYLHKKQIIKENNKTRIEISVFIHWMLYLVFETSP